MYSHVRAHVGWQVSTLGTRQHMLCGLARGAVGLDRVAGTSDIVGGQVVRWAGQQCVHLWPRRLRTRHFPSLNSCPGHGASV